MANRPKPKYFNPGHHNHGIHLKVACGYDDLTVHFEAVGGHLDGCGRIWLDLQTARQVALSILQMADYLESIKEPDGSPF